MKNPSFGTFIETINTFNGKGISNGLFEALESGIDCFVSLPTSAVSISAPTC